MELVLTCKGMSSVNWNCKFSDSDFEFIFGEDRVCPVHYVLAEFLSPRVHMSGNVILSAVFAHSKSLNCSVFLKVFSRVYASGDAVQVQKSNFLALLRLSQELDNDELLSSLLGMIKTESLSREETLLLFQAGTEPGTVSGFEVVYRVPFLRKTILHDLDLETAQLLLSSPSLEIEDEDSLYDFVRLRSEKDLRFSSLF